MLADCAKNYDGKTGDSSGKEYSIKNWYNGSWACMLRAPDLKLGQKIAQIGAAAAKNDNIGYSQPNRLSYYEQLKSNGWNPSKITSKCDADCSSSTSAAIIAASTLLGNNYKKISKISPGLSTHIMRNALKEVGFKVITEKKYLTSDSYLVPGDILLNDGTHVTINIGNGEFSGMTTSVDGGGQIVLKEQIAKLMTSDNYQYITKKDTESEATKASKLAGQNIADRFIDSFKKMHTPTMVDKIVALIKEQHKDNEVVTDYKNKNKILVHGNLLSFPTLVEAPFIELTFNNTTIGGYNNSGDKYPNYIKGMSIEKINGRINKYIINLSYQIRAGEDPNVVDKLLSSSSYTKTLKIRYGDAAIGTFFKEDEAIILDAIQNDSPQNNSIDYTITAVSSVYSIQNSSYTFTQKTSKPSTELINLLYSNASTSKELMLSFPGMINRNSVASKGYIPTNDKEMIIPGGDGMSAIERITQLVSYMQNPNDITSSYFLTFVDDSQNSGGAYFKINEVKLSNSSNIDTQLTNCYYVDVGFPKNNFVTNFSLDDNIYWPIYFKHTGNISKYNYDIDNKGNIINNQINPLTLDKFLETDVTRMNWWQTITSFPISAKLTIKGLMRPSMLMENIYIYATFYGQQDMASGLYKIIGQQDKIDGQGYSTVLSLLRIQK